MEGEPGRLAAAPKRGVPGEGPLRPAGPAAGRSGAAARHRARRAAGAASQELQLPNLSLEPSRTYTLSFWIKADAARTVYVDVSNQGPDNWQAVGLRGDRPGRAGVGSRSRASSAARDKIPGKARICFKFGGNATGFSLAARAPAARRRIHRRAGRAKRREGQRGNPGGELVRSRAPRCAPVHGGHGEGFHPRTDRVPEERPRRARADHRLADHLSRRGDRGRDVRLRRYPRLLAASALPRPAVGPGELDHPQHADGSRRRTPTACSAARRGGCWTGPSPSRNGTSPTRTIMPPAWCRSRRWWRRCRIGTASSSSTITAARAAGTPTASAVTSPSTASR